MKRITIYSLIFLFFGILIGCNKTTKTSSNVITTSITTSNSESGTEATNTTSSTGTNSNVTTVTKINDNTATTTITVTTNKETNVTTTIDDYIHVSRIDLEIDYGSYNVKTGINGIKGTSTPDSNHNYVTIVLTIDPNIKLENLTIYVNGERFEGNVEIKDNKITFKVIEDDWTEFY